MRWYTEFQCKSTKIGVSLIQEKYNGYDPLYTDYDLQYNEMNN